MNRYMEERNQKGFTLIELLVAIVVVGILTAVAIVGIAGLTNKGSGSACTASLDAATAASAVFYANSSTNAYPTTFNPDLTTVVAPNTSKLLEPQANVVDTANTLKGKGWTLTMSGGGASAPTFLCSTP